MVQSISNKNNTGAVNYSLVYSFDNDGRINKITRNNGLVDSFSYSNADRLLNETCVNGSTNVFGITYTYDKNGNRLSLAATGSHQQPQTNVAYTYTGNKLATIAGTAAPHTANAELIYGGFTPTYDYAGNRREDKTTGGAATAPQYYMTYNHKNERTVRGYQANSSVWKANTIQYVYDESSHLIGEYNADGTPLVEYVWMGDKPVAAIYGSGTASKTYWIVTDAQNTPRRLINAADGTTTVWAWDSTAFGVGVPGVQTVKFNLRFPGQYYDELTKQHYNHNRFYNPALGRYMEPDRIGLEGGLNPYIYANGNPVSNVDVTGMEYRASKQYSLGAPFTARLDLFPYKNETRHEFHIFNKGTEVGMFSEGTFFNKHGKVMDIPPGFNPSNMNRLKGLDIDVLRKMNRLAIRGTADIKGLNYRDKILDPIPRHSTTNFESFSKTGKILGYLGIGLMGYELYSNPNYTIDDAFIDVGGISRLGNSSLFNPSITFPADNFGNTGFYYHNYKD